MKFVLALILFFYIAIPVSSYAQGNFSSSIPVVKANKNAKQQLRVNSSKRAAQMAKARFGGKVLKVNKKGTGYRVKLIKTDGHIVTVYVNAKTGKVSGGK